MPLGDSTTGWASFEPFEAGGFDSVDSTWMEEPTDSLASFESFKAGGMDSNDSLFKVELTDLLITVESFDTNRFDPFDPFDPFDSIESGEWVASLTSVKSSALKGSEFVSSI